MNRLYVVFLFVFFSIFAHADDANLAKEVQDLRAQTKVLQKQLQRL